MTRTATIAASAAAAAGVLLLYASVSRVPDGSVAVAESGGKAELLQPGIHLHRPFGSPVAIYALRLPTVRGDVVVTMSDGPAYTLGYQITGVLAPDKALLLHRAASGKGVEGLLREVADRVIGRAAAARTTGDLVSGAMEQGAAQRAGSVLGPAGIGEVELKLEFRHPETLMKMGRALAPARLAGAIQEAARAALAEEPGSWEAHTAMGLALESQKDLRGAEKEYLDALTINSTALPPMAQLVALYTAVGELGKLDRLLAAALAADPNSVQHLNWLAASQMTQDRPADAQATIERALAVEPSNTLLLNNLAGVLLKQGRFEEAIAGLRRAVQASPRDRQSLYNLGIALVGAGRPQEGLEHLLASELAGAPGPPLLHAIAGAYKETGQAVKAREYEERARALEAGPPQPGS